MDLTGLCACPDSFATGCWKERSDQAVSFGQASFTDLDYADNISLLAELLKLLVPALELMSNDKASLGIEENCQKSKIQALGRIEGLPPTVTVHGHVVAVAEEFVYLSSLIHSSVQSTYDINRRSAMAHAVMQSLDLDNQIWRSQPQQS